MCGCTRTKRGHVGTSKYCPRMQGPSSHQHFWCKGSVTGTVGEGSGALHPTRYWGGWASLSLEGPVSSAAPEALTLPHATFTPDGKLFPPLSPGSTPPS